jgi:hypothetical protein
MTPEERRKRMEERMAAMSPEQRAQFEERMRARGFGPGGPGGAGQGAPGAAGQGNQGGGRGMGPRGNAPANAAGANAGRRGPGGNASSAEPVSAVAGGADSIDALFAPIVIPEVPGRVWLYVDKQLKSVRVRTALADGTFSEIVEGDLKEGQEVVVNMVTGLEPRSGAGQQGTGNPLMGPQRGGPPGGGNRGGGGGGRGF